MPHEALTKHDVKQTLAESVEAVVPVAIQKHVNGKVDKLRDEIKDLRTELDPLLEFGRTMRSIRKGIVWLTQPVQGLVIIIGAIIALIKLVV